MFRVCLHGRFFSYFFWEYEIVVYLNPCFKFKIKNLIFYFILFTFNCFNASIVALAIFILLLVLSISLPVKDLIPASLATTRTGPPALTPPFAGLSNTTALLYFDST